MQAWRTWSTDGVPGAERFAYWQDIRSRNLFGATVELTPHERADFHGTFSTLRFGDATFSELDASPYLVRRTAADVSRTPNDYLGLNQLTGGALWYENSRGEELVAPDRSLVLTYCDRPYASRPATPAGFKCRVLRFPFERCKPFVKDRGDLEVHPLAVEPGMAALLSCYFDAFAAQAPHLEGAAAEAAVQTLVRLTFVTRGLAPAEDRLTRNAVNAARLEAARQYVDKNLHRAELSPERAARAVGVSVRRLHKLFEPTGTSFTRYVLSRRLASARLMLAVDPKRSVLDVALASGIESTSVFYRGFQTAYGMNPTDYRRSLRTLH